MAGGGGGYDGDGAAPSEAPVPFMRPPPAGEKRGRGCCAALSACV